MSSSISWHPWLLICLQGFRAAFRHADLEPPFDFEPLLERIPHDQFVIHDQDVEVFAPFVHQLDRAGGAGVLTGAALGANAGVDAVGIGNVVRHR
jgi:hypothetical protein